MRSGTNTCISRVPILTGGQGLLGLFDKIRQAIVSSDPETTLEKLLASTDRKKRLVAILLDQQELETMKKDKNTVPSLVVRAMIRFSKLRYPKEWQPRRRIRRNAPPDPINELRNHIEQLKQLAQESMPVAKRLIRAPKKKAVCDRVLKVLVRALNQVGSAARIPLLDSIIQATDEADVDITPQRQQDYEEWLVEVGNQRSKPIEKTRADIEVEGAYADLGKVLEEAVQAVLMDTSIQAALARYILPDEKAIKFSEAVKTAFKEFDNALEARWPSWRANLLDATTGLQCGLIWQMQYGWSVAYSKAITTKLSRLATDLVRRWNDARPRKKRIAKSACYTVARRALYPDKPGRDLTADEEELYQQLAAVVSAALGETTVSAIEKKKDPAALIPLASHFVAKLQQQLNADNQPVPEHADADASAMDIDIAEAAENEPEGVENEPEEEEEEDEDDEEARKEAHNLTFVLPDLTRFPMVIGKADLLHKALARPLTPEELEALRGTFPALDGWDPLGPQPSEEDSENLSEEDRRVYTMLEDARVWLDRELKKSANPVSRLLELLAPLFALILISCSTLHASSVC